MPATRVLGNTVSTDELGAPGVASLGGWLDTYEDAPELRFPASPIVYDKMRRYSQLDSILRAIRLPIMRTQWRLIPDGIRPGVLDSCARELGLTDVDGRRRELVVTPTQVNRAGRRRMKRSGVVFGELLHHALLSLPFGFMPMEQVYDVAPPSDGQEGPSPMAHMGKLAPRMPRSLSGIDVARDGGLTAIRQHTLRRDGLPGFEEVTIPRDRLVMFVHEREGGDWTGRSILRSSYPHWLINLRLMKLGAAIVERNGMGVPVVNYPAGAGNRTEALRIAKAFRAGDEAGAALPTGYSIKLLGVEGDTADELPRMEYHDQAMGRAALAMFLNLGHDNGARSLGDTFVDYFVLAEDAIAEAIALTITEYVIRDFVELNYGVDEPYPDLVADPIRAEGTPTAEALAQLADKGLLGPMDDDIIADVRRRYGLPQMPEELTGIDLVDWRTTGGAKDPAAPVVGSPEDTANMLGDPRALAARALAVSNRLAQLAAA
jgi:hypothetical protein